jgi:hypothetical protein
MATVITFKVGTLVSFFICNFFLFALEFESRLSSSFLWMMNFPLFMVGSPVVSVYLSLHFDSLFVFLHPS